MKSITVIIPTYNRWPLICSSIDSVLNQSYPNTECMVVDDASSDQTTTLLKKKYGDRIKIVSSNENKGQSYCRNLGAELCTSDCICFLDSDDTLEYNAVKNRISFFNEDRDNIAVSFGLIRTPEMKEHPFLKKKKMGEPLLLSEYLENHSWCHNNGFLIDREIFLRNGMYNENLRNKEDIELLIRLLYKYPFYFSGTEIGEVRDVSSNRARNNYKKIIQQRSLFSDTLLNNSQLKQIINYNRMHEIICTDIEEELRAFYKLGYYSEYRLLYKHALKKGHIIQSQRFFKRFLISFIKSLIAKKKRVSLK